jgi:hypothetical protein
MMPESARGDADWNKSSLHLAEFLASLNHPGLAAIDGLERVQNTYGLVLELVNITDPFVDLATDVDELKHVAAPSSVVCWRPRRRLAGCSEAVGSTCNTHREAELSWDRETCCFLPWWAHCWRSPLPRTLNRS